MYIISLSSFRQLSHITMAIFFSNLQASSPTILNSHVTFWCFFFFFSSSSFIVLHFHLANSIHFQVNHFDPAATSILYDGDATTSSGAIELNDPQYTCHVGRAIYAERVQIWDSESRKFSDFNTQFSFIIDIEGRNVNTYGHGISFFMAPVDYQIPPNSAGGFLGLYNTSTNGSPNNHMVSVEFDSFSDGWDPKFHHVGINTNSLTSIVVAPWNTSLHSGDTADASITYNATSKNLSVSWNYRTTPNFPENSSLSSRTDLMEILPEWVIVGFVASTGSNSERHALLSWEFNSTTDFPSRDKTTKLGLIVGVTVPLGILAVIGFIALLILRRRRHHAAASTAETQNLTSINDDLERGAGPRRFSYKDLASATNNFSNERKLGEGGFGCVYRGYLVDFETAVAVKKISRGSRQGKKEYVTEVKIISRLRHRNLVQLIGWCHDQGEFLLVYEFMPNGSLDSHLFGKNNPLNWATRHKITLGLASALLYLHEEWEQCVVHRDIKSSNVILDSSFNVKLGDFGMARLMDHELGPQTTGLAGTFGYLAPEYVTTGKASRESDVYSFGVVALEIATGRRANDPLDKEAQLGLVEWIWDLYGRAELVPAVDNKLGSDFDTKQMECLMIVGLWCAHPDYSLRPSIRQAIQVLNFEAALPSLPAKMPVPIYHVPVSTSSISSGGASITYTSVDIGR